MSTPYAVPGNCKISADFNLLCHFRQINPESFFDYSPDNGNGEEMIGKGMMEGNSPGGLTDTEKRFNARKTRRAKYTVTSKAKYTGTRIGKRSESLGWNIYGRL